MNDLDKIKRIIDHKIKCYWDIYQMIKGSHRTRDKERNYGAYLALYWLKKSLDCDEFLKNWGIDQK